MDEFYIFGAGGCAKDVACVVRDIGAWENFCGFVESEEYYSERYIFGKRVLSFERIDKSKKIIVAVGDSQSRAKIVEKLSWKPEFITVIHPRAIVSEWVEIGVGVVIAAGCIVTGDVLIGNHVQLNVNTTVAHDTVLQDFVTTAPGVNICGNVKIGRCVNVGTGASIRNGVIIEDFVQIGMGSVVVNGILDPGIYVGNPARRYIK